MPTEADEQSVIAFLERSGEDWLVAECEPTDVERFRQMDHHVVMVNERSCVLLTYHLWLEPLQPPPRVYVLFQYADRHPRAPKDVQLAVQGLTFRRT